MYVQQLYTNCLAEAAYYIESEGESAIIDPIRETEPYIQLAKERGTVIKYVFETHFHADFVSGHIDLAKQTGSQIIYGPNASTSYKVYNAGDQEEFKIGKITLRVLHTPGHTPESSCYLLLDERGREHAIFTGDTLFVGDVGRPDLLDGVMTKEELAGMMYDSLNTRIKSLPDDVIVYPAHGPGSACGKNIGKETFSTIGEQKKFNYALQEMTREEFIAKLTDGILPPPQYFFEDARINKEGYQSIEEVMERSKKGLTVDQFKEHMSTEALILDTRRESDFQDGFIHGSINIGLNGQYAVWVGTLISIDQPLILVADKGKEEEAILRLARVGYEKVIGFLEGGIDSWPDELDTIDSISAHDVLQEIQAGHEVLDVRKPGEWSISRVKNASLISLSDLLGKLDSLDPEKTYVVHCAGGYRSMIACSLMRQQGFRRLKNVLGGFGALQKISSTITTAEVHV